MMAISGHVTAADPAPPRNVSFAWQRLSRGSSSSATNTAKTTAAGSSSQREMMALAADAKQSPRDSSPGILLKCAVENVFPKPELHLFGVRKDGSKYLLTDTTRQDKTWPRSRAHSAYLSAPVFDAELVRRFHEDGLQVAEEQEDSASPFRHPYHYQQERQERRTTQHLQPSTRQSFQFECVSSVDVKGASNLTKVVALMYTPSAETKHFFRSSAPTTQTSCSLLLLLLLLLLVTCSVLPD